MKKLILLATLIIFPACYQATTDSPAPTATTTQAGSVKAKVNNQWITQSEFSPNTTQTIEKKIAQQMHELFHLRWAGLEATIDRILIDKAAADQKKTVEEFLIKEVFAKLPEITQQDVEEFYNQNSYNIQMPLESIKDRIKELLEEQQREIAQQEFVEKLRGQTKINYELIPPQLPRNTITLTNEEKTTIGTAKVVLVEFSDYQCPYCSRLSKNLDELVKTFPKNSIARIFRHFPLPNHHRALVASIFSECANQQGKFWEMHHLVFANQKDLSDESLRKFAQQIQLNPEQLEQCITNEDTFKIIHNHRKQGQLLAVDGTPTLFVNGQRLSGGQPTPILKAYIEAELAR